MTKQKTCVINTVSDKYSLCMLYNDDQIYLKLLILLGAIHNIKNIENDNNVAL